MWICFPYWPCPLIKVQWWGCQSRRRRSRVSKAPSPIPDSRQSRGYAAVVVWWVFNATKQWQWQGNLDQLLRPQSNSNKIGFNDDIMINSWPWPYDNTVYATIHIRLSMATCVRHAMVDFAVFEPMPTCQLRSWSHDACSRPGWPQVHWNFTIENSPIDTHRLSYAIGM